MASDSNTSLSFVKTQNSTGSIHSGMSPVPLDIPLLSESSPSSPPLSCNVDQECCMASSTSTTPVSFPAVEERAPVVEDNCLIADTSIITTDTDDQQPDCGKNGVATKKQAWNVPLNGVNAGNSAVMGADSWPALSKSALVSNKASSTDSPKALSHGSPDLSQTGNNAAKLSSNHSAPNRQRSVRRGGRVLHQNSMTFNDLPPSNPVKSSGFAGESPRDNFHEDAEHGEGTYGGNESHQPNTFRRSNSGHLNRRDGSFHHGNGRRNHERGKPDWNNSHQAIGNRGLIPQHRVGPPPFVWAPVMNTSFIPPSSIPVWQFVPPMAYNGIPSPVFYPPAVYHPDSVRYGPLIPYPSMYYPPQNIQLPSKIRSQIDYYFSNENLVKDTFLRQKMDSDGWVSVDLIANFKKVTELTDDVQLILDAIRSSTVVEVQGDKLRRKNDWSKWIIAPSSVSSVSSGSTPQSPQNADQNMLSLHMKNFSMNENDAA